MTRTTDLFRRIGALSFAGAVALAFVGVACGGSSGSSGGAGTTGHAGTTGGAGSAGTAGTAGTAGSTGAGGAADNTPVGLCKQLVSTLCTRSNSCNTAGDAGAVDVTQCNTLEDVEFGCDRATSTEFPACLSDVEGLSCTGLFSPTNGLELPGSCETPLNSIPLSDGQMKCLALTEVICNKIAACDGITAPAAADIMNCEEEISDDVGCDFVVSVSSSAAYASCLADYPNAQCVPSDAGVDASVPADVPSCDNVFVGPTM